MSATEETLKLLKYYTRKAQTASVTFEKFVQFVKKVSEKNESKNQALQIFREGTRSILTSELEVLASQGKCNLDYQDINIVKVHFPEYFLHLIEDEYEKIEDKPETPFPDQISLGVKIPEAMVTSIDVKADFAKWLGQQELSKIVIVRLDFPEGIRNMILTSTVLFNNLLSLSLSKIQRYLTTRRNVNYVQNKLTNIFEQKKASLKELLDDIMLQKTKTLESIKNPTDFSYRVWTSLANLIIQEFKPKTNKLEEEHSFCQAAYLIGYYNAYYKSIVQKEKTVQTAFKQFDTLIRKSPYVFTVSDIQSFKDSQGTPLVTKCSREQLLGYVGKKTKLEDGDGLPEIVRIKGIDRKEYFIHKDILLPVVLQKVQKASEHLRKEYLQEWTTRLKNLEKPNGIQSDEEFVKDLVDRVKAYDPILWSLLRFDILYLAYEEGTAKPQVLNEIVDFFQISQKKLTSIDKILGINRLDILNRAKLHLPIWQNIPVMRGIVILFLRMFSNRDRSSRKKQAQTGATVSKVMGGNRGRVYEGKEEDDSVNGRRDGATSKAQLAEYRKKVGELKKIFLEEGKTVEGTLEELIDRWNPLFDQGARQNLVEDVNSMVRDFMRGLRRGFRVNPPDPERIRNMAERLSENKAFDKIKRKEYFKRYIEIYMLKLMSKK